MVQGIAAEAPVRQESLRAHNLALVLRQIATNLGPISRADLALRTGLTRATVSALVDDLIRGHLVDEVDPAPRAGAGRPANRLVVAAGGPAGLGIEINVDYLAACVVDLAGAVRHRVVRHTDLRGRSPGRVLYSMSRLAAQATAGADEIGLRLAGAVLAVPGLVDDGLIRLAPNLGWHDVDVHARLESATALTSLPLSLTVENEANLAALATLFTGGEQSFVYVSGEIGIGGGLVIDGRLFRGGRGWSGEIGHVTVDPDGPLCRCGSRGCLEQHAGQEAILRAAGLLSPDDPTQIRHDNAVQVLAEHATAGDRATLAALDRAATALGIVIAGVLNLLDLDTAVLGGGYTALFPWLEPGIRRQLAARVIAAGWSTPQVRPCALGTDAAVYGAARSVVTAILDRPADWLARSLVR